MLVELSNELVEITQQLVSSDFTTDLLNQNQRFAAKHNELKQLLMANRTQIRAAIRNQSLTLLNRLHEAELELELARRLGQDDKYGKNAMLRARRRASVEAPALFQALVSLIDADTNPR